MATLPELRPCPFCGAGTEDIVVVQTTIHYSDGEEVTTDYEVRCVGCNGRVNHDLPAVAVTLWNGTATFKEG